MRAEPASLVPKLSPSLANRSNQNSMAWGWQTLVLLGLWKADWAESLPRLRRVLKAEARWGRQRLVWAPSREARGSKESAKGDHSRNCKGTLRARSQDWSKTMGEKSGERKCGEQAASDVSSLARSFARSLFLTSCSESAKLMEAKGQEEARSEKQKSEKRTWEKIRRSRSGSIFSFHYKSSTERTEKISLFFLIFLFLIQQK